MSDYVKKALPLARTNANSGLNTTIQSWQKLIEVIGGRLDSFEYLRDQAQVLIKQSSDSEQFMSLLKELDVLVEQATYREETQGNPWLGLVDKLKFELNDFSLFHQFMADRYATAVNAEEITLDYALSDDLEYIRAFSSDGEALEDSSLVAMDTLFNSWLAEHHMVMQDGIIYSGTDNGEIMRDKKGALMTADVDVVKKIINHIVDGFQAFVKKNNDKLTIKVVEHPFAVAQEVPAA